MGIGPVPATEVALAKAGLQLSDIDLIELNEAFAAQALAVMREWNFGAADHDRTNVHGSGISLGHPVGATGGRMLATLARELNRRRRALRAGDHVHRRRAGPRRGFRAGRADSEHPGLPLSGLTVVEVSSFVAAPLCGMTLSQLGAQVIRVDPIGGASDVHGGRWRGRHVDLLDRAEQGKAFGHHRFALSRGPGAGPAADRRGRRHRGDQRRRPVLVVAMTRWPPSVPTSSTFSCSAVATVPPGWTTPSTRESDSRWSPARPTTPVRSTMCCRPGMSAVACMPRSPSSPRSAAATSPGRARGSAWRWRTSRWPPREIWDC